jgi:hypothetical protein
MCIGGKEKERKRKGKERKGKGKEMGKCEGENHDSASTNASSFP